MKKDQEPNIGENSAKAGTNTQRVNPDSSAGGPNGGNRNLNMDELSADSVKAQNAEGDKNLAAQQKHDSKHSSH